MREFKPGERFHLYGADGRYFKLDDIIYEALEDESDGYRSCLGSIEAAPDSKAIFFKKPVDKVMVVAGAQDVNDFDGISFISLKDGHCWLTIGTENVGDYYPCFIFRWSPRARSTHQEGDGD